MYQEPIFLEPVFKERIWGGEHLHAIYGYEIPSVQTGEAWVISAHENGPSTIENGPLQGQTLLDAWNHHGELFNKTAGGDSAYPLLVKLLDANANLSVQVHPDDHFANEMEGVPYGKTECWYVVSADPGTELVVGHHARTRQELKEMMNTGDWEGLLKRVPVEAGDFVHVPSGTIHAIGSGIVILETQQSSDITYRVYDYDRTDAEGNKRELHLDKAAQVTNVPDDRQVLADEPEEVYGNLTVKRLVTDPYFTVEHWNVNGKQSLQREVNFLQVTVLEGDGSITVGDKSCDIGKGVNFIIPNTADYYELKGQLEMVVSWV